MSKAVISVRNLSKKYALGVINTGFLFRDIQSWWALKRGKEDPHSKLDSYKYSIADEYFWALKNLNFDIYDGDRIGIIGKNGAGKSTLLKILSRITTPTEGNVKVRGKISSLLEVGTGFHGELTGRENIFLNGSILGMKKKEIDRKIDEIIDFSGIEKHIDTPVKRYSSGMYVRLAFAVAAHLDSDILIADEVLAVGDAEFQKKALGKMRGLSASQGRTVLFVSHNMSAVKSLCNKGLVLEKGEIKFRSNNIDESINYYMGTSDAEMSDIPVIWENDGRFYHPNFTPKKIEVLDMNGEYFQRPIRYEEAFKVRVTFEVNEFNSFCDFGIYIFLNGERIVARDIDTCDGYNQFDFLVPAKLLPPNNIYTISLASSIKNTSWVVDPFNFLISLNITISDSIEEMITYCKL